MDVCSARLHSSGLYRAYKKINGKEYQFYFKKKLDADNKQKELNSLSKLVPKNPFSSCGRLIGFRLRLRRRKGRKPCIIVRMQVGVSGNQTQAEIRYQDSFEKLWSIMRMKWIEAHSLLPHDVSGYRAELKTAKRIYMQDLSELEDQLN